MGALRDFASWPAGPLHVAIGVFDGVHLGHRALVARLGELARAAGARALAATFDPTPIQVLAPGAPPSGLSEADERARLLHDAGADDVVVLRFTPEFATLSAEAFVSRLRSAGDVRCVVVGPDFQFGHDREGDVPLLHGLGREHGFAVEVVPPIDHGGRIVSSTRIRNALARGDVEEAAELLGRPYRVRGRIVPGERRGRGLGFPTVNLAPPGERLLPRDGIYAMWVTVGDERHPAAGSLGVRPTFGGGGERRLEAYILDFEGDLYGETAEAAFVKRLRDEERFASAHELAEQIARDVEATRQALRAG